MTTTTQHGQVPDALRLAEEITNLEFSSEAVAKTIAAAADELCRLHVENASLRASPAASPTPTAEQQAAPKAAPGGQNESAYQRGYMDGMAKGRRDADAAPQLEAQEPAPLSEQIDKLERKLAIIAVVGVIDGHDVVRRESVLEIARRAALAAQGGKV